jgi:CheY-like chemotaxis protein
MSPDDIFAGQMWPWPEPALKRDAMGRVLFVNAAFLQMYGGRIEDWRGNVLTGWPMPQAPGMPYRLETRLPTEAGEQVYDWMEFTMADGNAFAMARNVTYLFQSPDPDPGASQLPDQTLEEPEAAMQSSEHTPSAMPEEAAPVFAEQMELLAASPAPAAHAPAMQSAVIEPPSPENQNTASDVAQDIAPNAAMDISAEVAADPVFDSASYANLAEAAPVNAPAMAETITPEITAPAAQAPAAEEREFERRALPIENEEAVLGNNWRDAVIAKAVGVGAAEEETDAPNETNAANTMSAATDKAADGNVRILLAEDNAINALLTRTLLEAEGHVVETVEDGALACEAMKSSKYDLIFMDMRMPNMDGLEATRKIRAMNHVSKGLPIIALTANAFDDDRNACFDSGMNDFMTKPVSAEELSEMVRTWTKNKAERDAAAA